ncbi:PLP-dependent transferase [Glarea lozoyensis ATCC 20868]|uniref:PLP-dependent transferase n=1 Tax=Glarea lozoyensis (strain ATCC 20868 / MF5171) TaxID=1116229 RepID=S3DP14_GLAL2|nr:PLP-dependent transferase [Glarea lozoyensis ATCC 20868]EPE28208.1 PLP-dependent transferase [Glarea lozoyensis ATCC 20868]
MMSPQTHRQAKFGLSQKAAHNSVQGQPWDVIEKMLANIWAPDNPDGLSSMLNSQRVFLGVAENTLMQQEIANYIKYHSNIISNEHLGYGVGPRGSPRLKRALALFFNSEFRTSEPVLERELLVLPGVAAVIDALTWSTCNDGEGIITPVPFYTGFKPLISGRSRGILVPAPFQCIEGYQGLDDIFDPSMNKKALENAIIQATQDGVKVRAVMISNPQNPLGRCYPAETLREIARFCTSHELHLISDEIFAISVYVNPQAANVTPFTSILELDLDDCIDRHFVHVAYGMSKDFCATGLRLGVLQSRNEGLIAAVSSICVFGWVSYVTQDMWADILSDEQFLVDFKTKNRQLLAKHCSIMRSFLDQHGIPFYTNVNAGVFIWVDLRRYLYSEPGQNRAPNEADQASSMLDKYRDGELKLFNRFLEAGVGIARGSSFSTEELGWFRVSFAIEEQALNLGLQRMVACLVSIQAENENNKG